MQFYHCIDPKWAHRPLRHPRNQLSMALSYDCTIKVLVYIVACQVHPALVKWSHVTQFYVNVSPLVHLSVSSRVTNVIVLWYEKEQTLTQQVGGCRGCRNSPPFERTKGFKDRVLSAPQRRVHWRPRLHGMRQYSHGQKSCNFNSRIVCGDPLGRVPTGFPELNSLRTTEWCTM